MGWKADGISGRGLETLGINSDEASSRNGGIPSRNWIIFGFQTKVIIRSDQLEENLRKFSKAIKLCVGSSRAKTAAGTREGLIREMVNDKKQQNQKPP